MPKNSKHKKRIALPLLMLFASIQFLFLGTIIYERSNRIGIITFVAVSILVLASHFQFYNPKLRVEFDRWRVAVWVFFGAIATYGLRVAGIDIVIATAIVGVFGASLEFLFKSNTLVRQIPASIYCGAFISMTNLNNDLGFVFLASAFTCLLFFFSKSILYGIGGKLGTMAFMGVVMAYAVQYSINLL